MLDLEPFVRSFVSQLQAIIRQEMLEIVRTALDAGGASPAPAQPSSSSRSPQIVRNPTYVAAARRSRQEIDADADRIAELIKARPGLGAERLKAISGVEGNAFEVTIKRLLGAKRIKKRGVKRSTIYVLGTSAR